MTRRRFATPEKRRHLCAWDGCERPHVNGHSCWGHWVASLEHFPDPLLALRPELESYTPGQRVPSWGPETDRLRDLVASGFVVPSWDTRTEPHRYLVQRDGWMHDPFRFGPPDEPRFKVMG